MKTFIVTIDSDIKNAVNIANAISFLEVADLKEVKNYFNEDDAHRVEIFTPEQWADECENLATRPHKAIIITMVRLNEVNVGLNNDIIQILNRKRAGVDCSEEESAEIKGWLRELKLPEEQSIVADIQYFFPQEYEEFLIETEKTYCVNVWRSGIGFKTIEVQASNHEQAKELALDIAPSEEFSEKDADYGANEVWVKE